LLRSRKQARKLLVLLGYVMEDDEWRRAFDEPFDVSRARDLLIEL
jgi:hypothetical protein